MSKLALKAVVFGFAVLGSMSVLSATVTWIGPDNGKWSDPENWVINPGKETESHRCPAAWDYIVIPATEAPLTLENDIKNLTNIRSITFTGTQPITLTGKRYHLYAGDPDTTTSTFKTEGGVVTNATDILLGSYDANLRSGNRVVFTGLIEKNDGSIRPCGDGQITFAGGIKAPLADLKPIGSTTVNYDCPVEVRNINYSTPVQAGFTYNFNAAGNSWSNILIGTWGAIRINTPNGFSPNTVIRWKNDYASMDEAGYYSFYGNQVVDRIVSDDPTYNGVVKDKSKLNGTGNGVLTLRATTNAVCYARLYGAFSLVYDPVDDWTQEFVGRTSEMAGSIAVKGGTLRVSGANVFSAVPTVTVSSGATLDVATVGSVVAFPAVKDLTLEAGATLCLTNGAVNAFTSDKVFLDLKDGAKIVLGDEAVLSFANVMVDGIQQRVGSYTGADGVPGAQKVSWLEGSAVVAVKADPSINCWVSPVSGDWEDGTKWSQLAAPTAGQTVFVTASGADYTVTINDAVNQGGAWKVANSEGTAKLAVAATVSNLTHAVDLNAGGVLEVVADGQYTVKGTPQLTVGPGATWRVAGGTCELIGNAPRYFAFAGDSARTSTVEVTSGTLVIGTTTDYPLRVPEFALLKATAGQVKIRRGGGWGTRLAYTTGGRIDISGTAEYILDGSDQGNYFSIFGDGETVFSGTSRFKSSTGNGSIGVSATAAGECAELTFLDEARINHIQDSSFRAGSGVGTSIVHFASSAVQGYRSAGDGRVAEHCFVGCDGGYGEIDVADGYVPLGYGYGIRVGGSLATTLAGRKTCDGCEGRIRVSGGVLAVKGSASLDWWFKGSLYPPGALTLGYGAFTLETSGRPYKGYVDMTGGIVTNITGDTILGAGCGAGTWTQSGGDAFIGQSETLGLRIGVVGGEGLVDLTGGNLTSYGITWVGGAPLQAFGAVGTALVEQAEFPYHRHDATGKIRVAGGSFKTAKLDSWRPAPVVYVGADGAGEIEMDGAAGSFVAAQLVLSNSVVEAGTDYEATTSAKLRFTLDADGKVSPVQATERCVVTPGSKLVLDVSKATGDIVRGKKLLVTPQMIGTFAEEDIEIVGPAEKVAQVKIRQTPQGVWMGLTRGTMLIVR